MEEGIANSESVFIVGGVSLGESNIEGTLDKTWQEIHDALQNKICIVVISTDDGVAQYFVGGAFIVNGVYHVDIDGNDFSASTPSGYPRVAK